MGDKKCSKCRRLKPRAAFARDRSRIDGLTYVCSDCRNAGGRAAYVPRPRPTPGRRYVAARPGDKKQARRRVNHLVDAGVIPDPNELPCADCGHKGGDKRHEYDHHKGYRPAHHETVESVCSTCHHRRERRRAA